MEIPHWTFHTQSVERCVKLVTEATSHVYTHKQKRYGSPHVTVGEVDKDFEKCLSS